MRVGILGAGQLGRMLALAGYPIGCTIAVLTDKRYASATPVSQVVLGDLDEPEALDHFARQCDVVTYESENVPVGAARHLAELVPVRPSVKALEVSQDRLLEKTLFQTQGVPTVPFEPVSSQSELEAAVATVGLPAVLKTRRMGYDGKGQRVLRTHNEVIGAFNALGAVPCILEAFCAFRRELSLVAVRGLDGQTVFYPLVENEHLHAVLRRTWAPAPSLDPALQQQAEAHAQRLLDELDYVGVLAIEFFEDEEGLRANEMAPRTHNSGHWSIDGAVTGQFENHLRAICGYPLGDTTPLAQVCMVNLIGTVPSPEDVLAIPDAHLHLYGKSAKPGRKLGHVTVLAPDRTTLHRRVERVEALLADPLPPYTIPD